MSLATTGSIAEGGCDAARRWTSEAEEETACVTRRHVPGEPGLWILIFGDMALFLLLFGGFMIDRGKDVQLFRQCSDMLHLNIGLVNTLILLTSSIAVALAVRAVRIEALSWAPVFAWIAFVCSLVFILNKYFEWGDLIRAGIIPTTNRFFLWYFIMTGVHLAHVVAGTCVLIYLLRLTQRARHGVVSMGGLEGAASYWHMVDLLWVILFPLLYLMR